MDIAFDPLGNKWIATEHGLVKFDNTTWTTYDVSNSGLLNDYVTSVVADSSGVIWSGSYDPLLTSQNPGGLCSFNGTVWTQYSPGNSGLQEKIIDRLAFDTLNNLWIMGATHGVSIFNPVVVNGYHCLDKNPTCFNTVPVSLVYFKGESRLGKNYLNWQAACTPGNVKFEIQRSIDGREFNFLGSIVSDDLRCSQPYDFTDSDPIEGKNYYRIKMIDDGGKISYSNTLVLMSKKSGFEIISFSPNPVTNDIAFLEISSDLQKQLRILVTDNSGKAVFKTNQIVQAGITQTRLDFKALAAGLYFISIYTTDNDKRSLRFLKNSK